LIFQREVKEIYPQWNATDGDIRVACSNSLMDAKIIRKLMSSLLKEAESGMTKFNVGEFSHNLVRFIRNLIISRNVVIFKPSNTY
jgi:hypothetical protein